MARRPKPLAPVGTALPRHWRSVVLPWQIWAMLAKIPETEYESVACAFEQYHWQNKTLSVDWLVTFKAWCRAELIQRGQPAQTFENLFG